MGSGCRHICRRNRGVWRGRSGGGRAGLEAALRREGLTIMSKQWLFVGAIVGGLALGATVLTKVGSEVKRVEVGAPAPDFHAIDLATGDSVSLRERYRGTVTLVNV